LNAIATAQPNDTIALNGMIELAGSSAFVTTNGLTFTCASSGAGLRARPDAGIDWLFIALSNHVTVEHLTLDATYNTAGALVVDGETDVQLTGNSITCGPFACAFFNNASRVFVTDNSFAATRTGTGLFGLVLFGLGEDVRIVRNQFQCAGKQQESCVHIEGDPGIVQKVLISRNRFEVDNQLAILVVGANDARVEKNTFNGILEVGGTGDPVIFITVSHGRITDNSGECGDACVFGAGGSPGLVLAGNQFQTAGSSAGFLLQESTDGDSVVGNTIVTTKPSFVPGFGGIRIRDGANAVVKDNIVTGPWANSFALTDVTNADVERNSLQGAIRFGIGITTEESVGPISLTGSLFRANRITGAGMAGIFAQLACNNSFVGNNLQGNAGDLGLVFDKTTGANTFTGDANLVVDNGAFDCDGDGVNDPNIMSGPGMARHGPQLSGGASGPTQHRIYGVLLK
jgi:hypothetical protein